MSYFGNAGSTAVNSLHESVASMVNQLGVGAVHALAPDNFEYYSCSLTLLDSQKSTKGILTFAVMPNSIVESLNPVSNIVKTNSGAITNFNSTFIFRDITIQGTFGKRLRLIIGDIEPEKAGEKKTGMQNFLSSGNLGFNMFGGQVLIKTGYGLTKFLQKMILQAYNLDDQGKPHMLVWTNHALNTSYVVEILHCEFSQSQDNNTLWYYNLGMKAVAPADALMQVSTKQFIAKVGASALANGIGKFLTDCTRALMQF